jgi:hypothetical protein
MSGLSDGDRQWLETRFRELTDKIERKDSKVDAIKIDVELLKGNAPHKCTEEIAKHEAASWSHNPKKAISLGMLVLGGVEAVRKFFGH